MIIFRHRKDLLGSITFLCRRKTDTRHGPLNAYSSSNALDVTTAERARAPLQPLLMVAKCSVMIGGHKVSSRRLLGRPGPKSDSAGSRWRPHHTRKSRAARAMTPVLQDKPHHSTDLAELVPTNILHYYLLFYCALCGKRPRTCRISLGGPHGMHKVGISTTVVACTSKP